MLSLVFLLRHAIEGQETDKSAPSKQMYRYTEYINNNVKNHSDIMERRKCRNTMPRSSNMRSLFTNREDGTHDRRSLIDDEHRVISENLATSHDQPVKTRSRATSMTRGLLSRREGK